MTRDRNWARSVRPIAAITASSFWPVKYVLKNSSRRMPSSAITRSVTVPVLFAITCPSCLSSAPVSVRESAVVIRSELEFQQHLEARARRGVPPPQRFLDAPRSLHTVQGEGDRLQQRRLAGTVGTDNAGESAIEAQVGQLVLAEVRQAESEQSHQLSTAPASRSTASSISTPRVTKRTVVDAGRQRARPQVARERFRQGLRLSRRATRTLPRGCLGTPQVELEMERFGLPGPDLRVIELARNRTRHVAHHLPHHGVADAAGALRRRRSAIRRSSSGAARSVASSHRRSRKRRGASTAWRSIRCVSRSTSSQPLPLIREARSSRSSPHGLVET